MTNYTGKELFNLVLTKTLGFLKQSPYWENGVPLGINQKTGTYTLILNNYLNNQEHTNGLEKNMGEYPSV